MLNSPDTASGPLPEVSDVLIQIDGTIRGFEGVRDDKGIQGLSPIISSSYLLRSKLIFADQECIERAMGLFGDQGPVHNFLRVVVEEGNVQEWQLLDVAGQVDVLGEDIEQSPTFQQLEESQRQFISRGGYEIVE